MNIASLIRSFSTGTYVVTRITKDTLDRGKTVAGTTSSVSITASVSPSSGADLERLPEGRIVKRAITIITTTELYLGGRDSDYDADMITVDSELWEVVFVEKWRDPRSSDFGYRCIAVDQ